MSPLHPGERFRCLPEGRTAPMDVGGGADNEVVFLDRQFLREGEGHIKRHLLKSCSFQPPPPHELRLSITLAYYKYLAGS